MAIAEMQKFNLVAMSYDKEAVLNALQRTGAVEVKLHAETEDTSVPPSTPTNCAHISPVWNPLSPC